MFPTLTLKKIVEVNNIINKLSIVKPKIKMTTKRPSRKQVIIPMGESNSNIIGSNASFYINTINRHLKEANCHMQVHLSENYIPIVISSPNYTSLPSMVATFLTTHLMVVLQPSGYSIFYGGDTPIQLGLL